MQVACPSCAHVITVPPEKAAVPNLKAKCRCGHLFLLSAAGPAPAASAARDHDPPGPSTGVVRVTAANADRVAEIRAANARAAAAFAATGAGGGTGAAAAAVLKPPPLPARAAPAPARPAAAGPKPAASATPAAAAPEGKVDRPRSLPVPWRRCQNHPQVRSEQVCPKCAKGFCDPCTQKVHNAAICPACEGLCIAAAAYEETQNKAKARDRSMMDEVGVIVSYPLRDVTSFVLLSLFTWFFGLAAGIVMYATLLSRGVLTWYSFNALSKVSIGNLRDLMPDFREVSEITHALWLSFAALVVSSGPFLLCVFLIPGASELIHHRAAAPAPRLDVAHAAPPAASPGAEGDEGRSPFEAQREGGSIMGPIAMLGIVIAAVWMVAYTPVALIVAALSKSVVNTLNPVMGIDTIKKMGPTYWQALALYLVIVVVQAVAGFVLGLVPIAGGLVMGFVNAYAALAIGCTLGLAVFKKGAELGWD
jgi:hypothetical protein